MCFNPCILFLYLYVIWANELLDWASVKINVDDHNNKMICLCMWQSYAIKLSVSKGWGTSFSRTVGSAVSEMKGMGTSWPSLSPECPFVMKAARRQKQHKEESCRMSQ